MVDFIIIATATICSLTVVECGGIIVLKAVVKYDS